MNPILIDNVSRFYDKFAALNELSLTVAPGSIYGFLGRNGSGKTTTIRMLAGLIKPQAGQVRIMGVDPFTMNAGQREDLGYMADKPIIPGNCKIRTLLQLGSDLYPRWDRPYADALISRYGLNPKQRFSTLSQGNQRLVQFILAVVPRPKVLLLDEPVANLDVVARRQMLDDILALVRDCQSTVLFSTHVLSDVERVADHIGILYQGKLRLSESLDGLKDSLRQVRFYGFPGELPDSEIQGGIHTQRTNKEITVTLRIGSDDTIRKIASQYGCQFEVRSLNLEDAFIQLSQ